MKEEAARIVSAVEHAIRHLRTADGNYEAAPVDPSASWDDMHCSAMFRETLRQLEQRSSKNWNLKLTYGNEDFDANDLGGLIRKHPEDWEVVDIHKTQSKANDGNLVIGSLVKEDGPGHLVIVYPTDKDGDTPRLRDGNVHPNVRSGKPGYSTYGAVPVTRIFSPKDLLSTKWFRFRRY